MKKILIVSHALELGGAERSLIGLLGAMDPTKYEIDLFLLRHEGELMKDIPPYVNLLPEVAAYTVLARPMVDTLREGHFLLTAARIVGKICASCYQKMHHYHGCDVAIEYSHKYTWRFMPDIAPNQVYDLAISFLTPHYIVTNKVRARRKVAWIHTDYAQIDVDVSSELKMWSVYNAIASISESVGKSFAMTFPTLKEKLVQVENILPEGLIKRQAEENSVSAEIPNDCDFKLLSIGRYCYAKNFDQVPEICAALREEGLDVKWYIIGFGGDEQLIRDKICEHHMEQYVIMLGKKENPYPYIKACDLYVQPSRYEGKSVTVREAQMLGKPVIITRYATSASQLEDGVDGVIVPMDNEGCAAGIAAVLKNRSLLTTISENCKKRDYSNAQEVQKLETLIL